MQLVDELSMIYTTCIMCYACFSFGASRGFSQLLAVGLIGLSAFITVGWDTPVAGVGYRDWLACANRYTITICKIRHFIRLRTPFLVSLKNFTDCLLRIINDIARYAILTAIVLFRSMYVSKFLTDSVQRRQDSDKVWQWKSILGHHFVGNMEQVWHWKERSWVLNRIGSARNTHEEMNRYWETCGGW